MNNEIIQKEAINLNNSIHKTITGVFEEISEINQNDFIKLYNNKNNKTKKINKHEIEILKKKRERFDNPSSDNFNGPWAKYKKEIELLNKNKINTNLENEQNNIIDNNNNNNNINNSNNINNNNNNNEINNIKEYINFQPYSLLHIENEYDYQGRSFLEPPTDLKNIEHTCYIPKKLIYTYYNTHDKNIQTIKFFPKYGHYLLSCGLDGKVKLWDVLTNRKIVKTYIGHTEGVRDICFNYDGKRFLSCGFDKKVINWDTETGKPLNIYNLEQIPFSLAYNCDSDKNTEFIVGTNLRKIYQFDSEEEKNEPIVIYDDQLAGLNCMSFWDNYSKFIACSDDKKIHLYEYGINVAIRHISSPTMHSIPYCMIHPNGKFFLGQSLENKIVVYDCKNKFRIYKKKSFTGHINAGYSCGFDCSPDGQFVCSGDCDGKIWFWDWKNCKNYLTINAHKKLCIDIKWHPIKQSLIASASWDGTIKLWDSK